MEDSGEHLLGCAGLGEVVCTVASMEQVCGIARSLEERFDEDIVGLAWLREVSSKVTFIVLDWKLEGLPGELSLLQVPNPQPLILPCVSHL